MANYYSRDLERAVEQFNEVWADSRAELQAIYMMGTFMLMQGEECLASFGVPSLNMAREAGRILESQSVNETYTVEV